MVCCSEIAAGTRGVSKLEQQSVSTIKDIGFSVFLLYYPQAQDSIHNPKQVVFIQQHLRKEVSWSGGRWKRISRHETDREVKLVEWETLLVQRASTRENWCWTGVLRPLLYPGFKEWDRGLEGHSLIRRGTYTGCRRSRANTSSLWGRRGDRSHCSINSYNVGEGRTRRVWFFHFRLPRPSLVQSALSSLGYHIPLSLSLFLGPILWPLLLPCSSLTIYLFPFSGIWEPSLKGKGAMTTLASFGCTGHRGALGSLCLLCVRMHLQREMRVHGMIRRLVSALSGCWPGNILVKLSLGDLLYSRRNNGNPLQYSCLENPRDRGAS